MKSLLTCPICGQEPELVTGQEIYPGREDLCTKNFWLCRSCDAYVGCHGSTTIPLGTLADKELREMRKLAHAAFDPVWKDGPLFRSQAYRLLALHLKLDPAKTHIAMFDVTTCHKVVEFAAAEIRPKIIYRG